MKIRSPSDRIFFTADFSHFLWAKSFGKKNCFKNSFFLLQNFRLPDFFHCRLQSLFRPKNLKKIFFPLFFYEFFFTDRIFFSADFSHFFGQKLWAKYFFLLFFCNEIFIFYCRILGDRIFFTADFSHLVIARLEGNLKIYDKKVTKLRSEQKVEVSFLLFTLKQCFRGFVPLFSKTIVGIKKKTTPIHIVFFFFFSKKNKLQNVYNWHLFHKKNPNFFQHSTGTVEMCITVTFLTQKNTPNVFSPAAAVQKCV